MLQHPKPPGYPPELRTHAQAEIMHIVEVRVRTCSLLTNNVGVLACTSEHKHLPNPNCASGTVF